jgi:hypothetical protein
LLVAAGGVIVDIAYERRPLVVKAVVRNGIIVPRDPLPEDWREGTEVEVAKREEAIERCNELDRWHAELEAIAAQGDPENDRLLDAAIGESRQREKELARRKMDLPE